MVFNVQLSWHLFFASLVFGAVSGAVYDIFRVFRVFAPHNSFAVFAEDTVYCVSFAAVMCVLYYNYTNGRIRLYALICAAAGFSAYYFTLGKVVSASAVRIKAFICRTFGRIRAFLTGKAKKYKRHLFSRRAYGRGIRSAADAFGALRYIRRR